jgi:16S rRNA (adenine1518-N6/adenine1519-N6)-dimethyltransferase
VRKRSTGSSSPDRRAPRPERRARAARVRAPSVPSDPVLLTRVLDALEIVPSKGMGQNFLIDPAVADREAALIDVPPGSPVLEVGGGLGQLTRALVEHPFQVTVVEKEPRLAAFLGDNFGPRVRVVVGDARTTALPPFRAAAGNLPFVVAQEVLERLISLGMERGAFLVQKEVGERLAASPGHRAYGRPTVLLRVDGTFDLAGTVPRTAFFPPPKVDGALIVWRRDPLDPGPQDRAVLEQLVALCFEQRRKMLGGRLPMAVARWMRLPSPSAVAGWVERAGWPAGWGRQRAEEIPPDAYVALANVLTEEGASADRPRDPHGSVARAA